MGDAPELQKVEAVSTPETGAEQREPLINELASGDSVVGDSDHVVKTLSSTLMDKGIMPAMDNADLPETIGAAATALGDTNISLQGDGGLSSASAVSTLLKAAGQDIEPTMNIQILRDRLADKGWQSSEYKPGDPLKPGDLLMTTMQRQGRNVGVVGQDGKTVYSHSFREGKFVGHENWRSRFVTVMRAPEKQS